MCPCPCMSTGTTKMHPHGPAYNHTATESPHFPASARPHTDRHAHTHTHTRVCRLLRQGLQRRVVGTVQWNMHTGPARRLRQVFRLQGWKKLLCRLRREQRGQQKTICMGKNPDGAKELQSRSVENRMRLVCGGLHRGRLQCTVGYCSLSAHCDRR